MLDFTKGVIWHVALVLHTYTLPVLAGFSWDLFKRKNETKLPAMDLHFTSQRGTPLSEVLARHNGSPWIHLHFAQGSSWHACKAIREYHAPAVPFLVGDPLQESPTIHCYPFILFGKKRQQERNVSCFPRTQHKLPKRHHSNTELINQSMASEHLS